MATRSSFNKNNSAIKRIMQEARELANDPSTDYTAAPLEDNLFEWHCTIRGPPETDFEGGLYHFRIILPSEYPFRPPSLMMLTPSGRFETNTKLCISFTNYHEELWQPAWGVRTAIIGLQGFFPLKGQAAMGVGSMEAPSSERRRLAKLSREWVCPSCKITNHECLPDLPASTQDRQERSDSGTNTGTSTSTSTGVLVPSTELPSNSTPITSTAADTPEHVRTASAERADPSHTEDSTASVEGATAPVLQLDVREDQSASSGPSERVHIANDDASGAVSQAVASQVMPGAEVIVPASSRSSPPRPPLALDALISVLLILVLALVCRKFL